MDDHSPYACASTGEESPRGAHDNDRRGYWSRGTKPRRLASRVAVLASVAALGLMPVPAGTSARPADALLSADSTDANPESEASLGTASMRLKIEQSEFELLPKQKMFRHGHFQFRSVGSDRQAISGGSASHRTLQMYLSVVYLDGGPT